MSTPVDHEAMHDVRPAKKSYHSPALEFHGRFGEITRQVGCEVPPPGKAFMEIPDNPDCPWCVPDVS
jgi:hypothetical protein